MKALILSLTLVISASVAAQDRFADVTVESTAIGDNLHMLTGAGGNLVIQHGADGVLLIDDQYQQLAEKIANRINDITGEQVSFLINTHFHGDHVGSNSWFKTQQSSTIMAHDNVRKRLAADDKFDGEGLPVLTFGDSVTLHINGDTIDVFHLPHGHTDGDIAVWFKQANVLHPGDLFFNERYPFIDLSSGGSVDGYIANVEQLISNINEQTVIVPGHGPKANKAEYQRFLAMIKATRSEVMAMKENGLTAEQAVKQGLSEKWQAWAWNFITEERWINTLYSDS